MDSLSFSFVAVTVIGTLEGSEAMRSLRWLWLRLRLLLLRTTFLPFRGLRRVLLGYLVSRGSVLDVPRAALEESDSRGDKHDECCERRSSRYDDANRYTQKEKQIGCTREYFSLCTREQLYHLNYTGPPLLDNSRP